MIRGLGTKVIIKEDEVENKTTTGIILTNQKEKATIGVVISTGEKCEMIRTGDKVLFSKYSGSNITFQNEKYLSIEESDLLGIIVE